MTGFDTFVVVDWSGGNDTGPTPRKDAIWAAVVRDNSAEPPLYFRNRPAIETWLTDFLKDEIAAGRRVLAGFDFPFGYPAGFAAQLTGQPDPLAVWDWFAENLTDTAKSNNRFDIAGRINARFPGTGPFWFNGVARDIDHLPRKGTDRGGFGPLPERRAVESLAKGSFTCWQMGGAGAVGSQVMTGMATLSRLRASLGAAVSVWPFQPLNAPIALVEVWPSLLASQARDLLSTGLESIKDAAQVRLLAATLAQMQDTGTLHAALSAPTGPDLPEEGWILGVGAEAALIRAGLAALRPDLKPPRLKNDCFALPPGVDWTPVDQALDLLRDRLAPVVGTEEIETADGLHRVLARDHAALRSNPPGANSAVDGYGFAHAATGSGRQVLPLLPGRSAAGQPYAETVPAGHAIRILTGALLPDGVDTVVLQEDVTTDSTHIAFEGPVKARANTRRSGEDVEAGATALTRGQRLRPPDIALLSALGLPRVQVFQRLRVAALSTGDEIVPPGSTTDPARTYDANRPMLLSLAQAWGYRPVDLGHAPDDREQLRERLDRASARADAIFTSGGASAGDEDHVSALLTEAGAMANWRVAVKPGRPLALGLWNGVPVFGLPGNPVAALVCALIFARPALSVLAGAAWETPQGFTVPAAFDKNKKPGRREYLRARLTPDGRAEVFASEGSGRISGLSWATGLVEIGDAAQVIRPGDPVRFLPYSGFGL